MTVSNTGFVSLVGAGPGCPDLLTVKALRLLQNAQVVVHDRLVSKEIMALISKDAELIYVGKQESNHIVPQDQINQLLCDLAHQGKHVIRLKGGDPFMFGRGGEEIEVLAKFGISYEIVPGITAAMGSTAYAGIPLTHRNHTQSVAFITGHIQPDGKAHDWEKIANSNSTLVFYMGLKQSAYIAEKLMQYGMDAMMPCAVIEKGTTLEQKVTCCTLIELWQVAAKAQSPALIVVGTVVSLQQNLSWFN